jgi:hypothetical protein
LEYCKKHIASLHDAYVLLSLNLVILLLYMVSQATSKRVVVILICTSINPHHLVYITWTQHIMTCNQLYSNEKHERGVIIVLFLKNENSISFSICWQLFVWLTLLFFELWYRLYYESYSALPYQVCHIISSYIFYDYQDVIFVFTLLIRRRQRLLLNVKK